MAIDINVLPLSLSSEDSFPLSLKKSEAIDPAPER